MKFLVLADLLRVFDFARMVIRLVAIFTLSILVLQCKRVSSRQSDYILNYYIDNYTGKLISNLEINDKNILGSLDRSAISLPTFKNDELKKVYRLRDIFLLVVQNSWGTANKKDLYLYFPETKKTIGISYDDVHCGYDPLLRIMQTDHDRITFDGKYLLRSFPYYHSRDANCCPSGGRLQVLYRLMPETDFRPIYFEIIDYRVIAPKSSYN